MKHSIISLLIVLFICSTVHAQINVGSNTAPDSSAMLQISGNTKGFLPPRMSRDSMYLIAKPARGLLVFNTTDSLLFMRRDSGWVALAAGDQVWQKNGDAIYNNNTGFVGIGTNNPSTLLHVEGANPLTLLGVADGTTDITDSVLTITNGLVRKIPLSSLAMVSNGISQAEAPLVYSNGVISINQSSTTDDGYLSASDYNIFNSKVSSISLTAGTLYPTTSFGITGGAATATLSLNTQTKNKVFAGPVSGANAQPTFRTLVPADLPVATSSALGVVSVGSGLSVTAGGVLSTTASSGSVTSVSVASANGLTGTVTTPTTTPAITLSTTVTGMVKGNGTALSAATLGTDYAPGTAANTTGIVKSTTGTGALTTATASDFPTLNQNTTGNAATVTTNANLTGDVTSVGNASTIASGAVTNAKLSNMATQTFKGRTTAGTGSPEDLTATQATAMLNTFNTAKGLVPGVVSNTLSFLRADGTFAVPPGTNINAGTVTSVSITSANGVSGTVATNTTTPAISLALGDITPTSVAATGTVTGSNLSGSHSGTSSGTNTGDETNTTIKTKLGAATTTNDGYLTSTDWNTFNNKASTANVISSLNGLTSNSQTFATPGTTGTAPAWSSAGSIHTLNIPIASATGVTAGLLSNADWNSFNNKANATGIWATVGNSGTTSGTNFLGTTDNASFKFRTNNTQALLLDSLGNAAIGSAPVQTTGTNIEKLLVDAGTTNSFNVISGKGSINNYLQLNIQNKNAGTNASSDVVATADNGDESNNYVDLGINSSANTANFFGAANDAYLYAQSQNMLIGAASPNKSVVFLTGGGTQSTNERMRINGSGNVGIGTNAPLTALHVSATSNPLTLNGVQTGTSTDSVLTISGSVVKKIASSTLTVSSSNAWALVGNSNTLSNNYFLGTTNSDPLIIKLNNQISGRLDAANTYLGYQSGYNNGTAASQNTGLGYHALFSNTGGTYNTAIGYGALQNNASGSNNIGVGNNAAVFNNSSNSIAIGTNSNINNSNAIAIGNTAQTNNTNAISIGNNTYTNGNYGISIGSGPGTPKTQAYGDYATALGYNAYAGGTNSISIGQATNSSQPNSISIGNASSATGTNSTAIGYNAAATVDNTIVLGDKSNANVSVAIGPESFTAGAREKLLVDAGTSPSFNIISARGNYNNYMQLNVQNRNGGGNASSDLVATADNGDESNNYVDLGINSSGNTANYFGGAGDAYLYAQTQNMLVGTASAFRSVVFLTGGGTQSNNERMRIDGSGNVGIGTSSPSTKLQIVGTNPLTLNGVQTGTNTSSDSILTITNGLVRKLPIVSIATTTNAWSTTGNAGTNPSSNFLGTTDAQAFVIRQNNTQAARFEANSITFGNGATVNASTNSYALGTGATVGFNRTNSFAIGNSSSVGSDNSFALGNSSTITTNATNAFAIGNSSSSNSNNAIAIGTSAYSGYSLTNPVSIGANSAVNGSNGVALGNSATIGNGGLNSTAIGALTSVTASNSTAIGYNASTTQANTVIIGDRSNTSLAVGIGSETFTFGNREKLLVDAGTGSFNVISGKGDLNNYLQLNIKNANAGGMASSDVVATANNGDEGNNYIDMGINSSGNSSNYFGSANDAYLLNIGQNMFIGTGSSGKAVVFLTGGGTQSSGTTMNNERMRIDGSGNVGIGINNPAAALQLKAGTSAANTAPLKLTSGTNLSTPENGAVEYDGTNYFATQGNVRYTLAKTLTNTATLDFPSTGAASASILTITVNGAADGDAVTLGTPGSAAGSVNGVFSAYVSSPNTVTVKFSNSTAAAADPNSGTFRVSILKY